MLQLYSKIKILEFSNSYSLEKKIVIFAPQNFQTFNCKHSVNLIVRIITFNYKHYSLAQIVVRRTTIMVYDPFLHIKVGGAIFAIWQV